MLSHPAAHASCRSRTHDPPRSPLPLAAPHCLRTPPTHLTPQVGKAKAATPFLISHWAAWGAVAATSLVATLAAPTTLGPQMALPFNLAATLLGFLLGNAMPKAVQVRCVQGGGRDESVWLVVGGGVGARHIQACCTSGRPLVAPSPLFSSPLFCHISVCLALACAPSLRCRRCCTRL